MKILFVLLIVALIGCREKKSNGVIIIDDAVLLTDTPRLLQPLDTFIVGEDTLVVGPEVWLSGITSPECLEFMFSDTLGNAAIKDCEGKWEVTGDCTALLDEISKSWRKTDSIMWVIIREKDSIINELSILLNQANKTQYQYAINQ